MSASLIKVLFLGVSLAVAIPALAQKADDSKVCADSSCENDIRKLSKLARNGSGYAAAIVAMAYATGDGVEQSNKEAERYLRLGVRRKEPMAMYLMSDWLDRGFIVKQDKAEAAELLDKAATAEFAPAMFAKAVQLLQVEDADSQQQGLQLLQQAADTRLVDAMYLLARLKHTGAGTEIDLEQAGKLYKELVLAGVPDTQPLLDDVIAQLQAQQGDSTLIADFNAVKDIEVIKVTGSRDVSTSMLTAIVRQLDSSALYDNRSIGSRIKGVSCEDSGSNCGVIKPDNKSSSISQALSGN